MKTTYVYSMEQCKIVKKKLPKITIKPSPEYQRWLELGLVRHLNEIELRMFNNLLRTPKAINGT